VITCGVSARRKEAAIDGGKNSNMAGVAREIEYKLRWR